MKHLHLYCARMDQVAPSGGGKYMRTHVTTHSYCASTSRRVSSFSRTALNLKMTPTNVGSFLGGLGRGIKGFLRPCDLILPGLGLSHFSSSLRHTRAAQQWSIVRERAGFSQFLEMNNYLNLRLNLKHCV